tara:strand:+ start:1467 stop:2033 length:567 start_codon:yes stop_codon:yes gene_type:complete
MINSVKSSINPRLLKIVALSAVLLGAAGLSLPVCATSSTSDINVSANISASCTMSNTDLIFGAYDAIVANATADLTTTATISTTCTSGTTGVVTMGQGEHVFYCVINDCHRRLANSEETSFLSYNIYTDASYYTSAIWNNDVEEMRSVAQVVGSGVSQDLTVYGEIPKNQKYAAAGSYNDTINITLTY